MRTRIALLLCLAGCTSTTPGPMIAPPPSVSDEPPPRSLDEAVRLSLAQSDYRPTDAVPAAWPSHGTVRAPLITQKGEIVVLEGGSQTVTAFDSGYGIVLNGGAQNPMGISKELLDAYPDEFDVLVIFTTFPDLGSQNSVAWYVGIRSNVKGIGVQAMDNGAFWGSAPGGRLHGFINMQYIGQYGPNLADPQSYVHAVVGQEFGHQWGSFTKYVDSNGQVSDAILGRDGSHWATTLQANGSVMDGNEWEDLGEGKFKLKNNNYRFSELDQYIMGLRGPDDVPDFFRIDGATYKGKAVDPAYPLPNGLTITGTREDITIDQIIKANGARIPDYVNAPKDFRVAIVLVTRPGETGESVNAFVDRLEAFRSSFEQTASEMSDGRLRICTRSTAPCDSAGVVLTDVKVTESQGNGDGLIDPGETVAIDFSVKSTGFGDALAVTIDVQEPEEGSLNIITSHLDLGDVKEGGTVKSSSPLLVKIPPSVECGVHVRLPLILTTDGRAFPAALDFDVGVRTVAFDGFEHPDLWTTNPYGTDTASLGTWAVAPPKGVDALYTGVNLVTQPSQDYGTDGTNALVTGPEAGQIGEHDVDDGVTTAVGPAYDIGKAKDPILTWYTWHFGYDFNTAAGAVGVKNDALYTEASTDGGTTWTVIDVDTSNEQKWLRKQVRLADVVSLGPTLRLRFTMSDDHKPSVAEALVDDIRIWDQSPVCQPETRVQPGEDAGSTPGTDVSPDASGAGADVTPPAAPADDAGGCSAGGRSSPLGLGLLALVLGVAVWRRRRAVAVVLLVAAMLAGCGDTAETPPPGVVDDPGATETTPAPDDTGSPVEETASPVEIEDAGSDPGPTLGEGPSYACLVKSCETSVCADVGECAIALDCAADCDTIACAEACLKTTPPPFKGVLGNVVACGAEAACFAGGSGLTHCGDDVCGEDETIVSCKADCGLAGHPEAIYECIIGSCQVGNCINKTKCKAALQCVTACKDLACANYCVKQNSGQGQSSLIGGVECAVTAGCLGAEIGFACGNGTCDLSEGPLDCPGDCGEPTPGYKCLVEGCTNGFCVNSPTCNAVLVCLGLCTDAACSAACIAGASGFAKNSVTASLECAVEAGCIPKAALPDPCGNGQCDAGENPETCAADCKPDAMSCKDQCGEFDDEDPCHCDEACVQYKNCCSDYVAVCLGGPVCGDETCDSSEGDPASETYCAADCAPPQPCQVTECPDESTACSADAACAEAGMCLAVCAGDAACGTACGDALEGATKDLFSALVGCAQAKGCVK